jgi:hypothetical protein
VEPESFEQVRALDDAAVRRLLDEGRPEQRVWAIWALAQRAGEDAGQLARAEARQPDPGVRRTLAVILASHGELDLLVALARHDPSMAVRASALQLVARLAGGDPAAGGRGGRAELRAVLEAAREPELVTAILGAIGAGAPGYLIDLAERALDAEALDVQLEGLEALLRVGTPPAFEEARRWLLALADPAIACEAWIRAAGGLGDPRARAAGIESLARSLAGTPVQVRARVLQRIEAPPWSAVARLVEGSDGLLQQVLRRADVAIPAHALAGAILRGLHAGFVERLTEQIERAGHGRALLADVRRGLDLDDVQPEIGRLMGRAVELVRAREIPHAEEVLAELAELHPVEQLVGLENALLRWLDDRELGALAGVLPELRAFCERQLAVLPRSARQQRPRRRELHGQGGARDLPWDAWWGFQALHAAILRLAE